MNCPNCRTEVPDDAQFCHNCGAAIPQPGGGQPLRARISRRLVLAAAGAVAAAVIVGAVSVFAIVQPFGGDGQVPDVRVRETPTPSAITPALSPSPAPSLTPAAPSPTPTPQLPVITSFTRFETNGDILLVTGPGTLQAFNLYSLNFFDRQLTLIAENVESEMTPVWSHDGRRIAYVTVSTPFTPSELAILDAETGVANSYTLPGDFPDGGMDWTADSSTVIFWARFIGPDAGQIVAVNADTGATASFQNVQFCDGAPWWDPARGVNGIAFVDRRGANRLMLGTDFFDVREVDGLSSPSNCQWSPTGTHIAVWGTNNELYVINSTAAKVDCVREDARGIGVTWSPDGNRLVWRGKALYSLDIGQCVQHLVSGEEAESWAWLPDGNRIFARYPDGRSYVVNYDGTEPVQLFDSGFPIPSTSPDGGTLFIMREEIEEGSSRAFMYFVDPNSGQLGNRIGRPAGDIHWSYDGSKIAFVTVGLPAAVNIVDVSTKQTRRLTGDTGYQPIGGFEWSPDARAFFVVSATHVLYGGAVEDSKIVELAGPGSLGERVLVLAARWSWASPDGSG